MKRLCAVLLLLLINTSIIAQDNSVQIKQQGENHLTNINQSGFSNSSSVLIKRGAGSQVIVEQIGNKNQSEFVGSSKIKGVQYQAGNNNLVIAGTEKDFGSNSAINQIQIGNNNKANAQSEVLITSITVFQTQIGNYNVVIANKLRGGNNSPLVINQTQIGNKNLAKIIPTGLSQLWAEGGSTTQIQIGDKNSASLKNVPGASRIGGTFRQVQFGDGNTSTIRSFRTTILAQSIQTGFYNVAIIDQFRPGNSSEIYQTGNDNESTVLQYESNKATIIQIGDNNFASLDQKSRNTRNNVALSNQKGKHNFSDISQKEEFNFGKIEQTGNRNKAGLAQDAVNNTGSIRQVGNNNHGIATQSSDRNFASLIQLGHGNLGVINQN